LDRTQLASRQTVDAATKLDRIVQRRRLAPASDRARPPASNRARPNEANAQIVGGGLERGGNALEPVTRADMEQRFGRDLSRVRVHTDAAAAASARELGAVAYTVGAHIVFEQGQYQPYTEPGRRLLAHELAHALQQGMVPRTPPLSDLSLAPAEDQAETEARRVGERATGRRCACGEPITQPGGVCARCAARMRARSVERVGMARVTIQRQPSPATAQSGATPAPDWRVAARAFNLILQREFPLVSSAWYLGTRSDLPPGGGVRADLKTGRNGSVEFALSPDFAPAGRSAVDAASDPALIAAVRTEVMRVLDWRLAQGILTAHDVAAPFISAYLRAMSPLALRALRARPTVEPAAAAELDRILAITTQLPAAAQFTPTGAAALTINGTSVRILPDVRAGTENKTEFRLNPNRQTTPAFRHSGGRVTQIDGALPTPPVVEIFTSYAAQGPQAALDPLTAPSGYGRGTTAADVAAGTTSLRFHESRHGEDFLRFIAGRPYPRYTGRAGMTVQEFKRAGSSYLAAVAAWAHEMGRASLCATDCVGSPDIDTFGGNTGAAMKCSSCRP
jgi:Domain of unknown function (DUF4157)